MHIVIDTSALLAVIVAEPERHRVVKPDGGTYAHRPWSNYLGNRECLLGHAEATWWVG